MIMNLNNHILINRFEMNRVQATHALQEYLLWGVLGNKSNIFVKPSPKFCFMKSIVFSAKCLSVRLQPKFEHVSFCLRKIKWELQHECVTDLTYFADLFCPRTVLMRHYFTYQNCGEKKTNKFKQKTSKEQLHRSFHCPLCLAYSTIIILYHLVIIKAI